MKLIVSLVALFGAGTVLSLAEPSASFQIAPSVAPPMPPAPLTVVGSSAGESRIKAAAIAYSIGDPTPEEQLYLELINRARANPPAEAALLAASPDALIQKD